MIIDHNNFTAEALPMYSRVADAYARMAAAFADFEQVICDIDVDNDTGFAPFPGDVAIGFEVYANHLRTVCQHAAEGKLELAAAMDLEYGESIKQFLDCQIREFAVGYHEFALGCDATRSPLDGGTAA